MSIKGRLRNLGFEVSLAWYYCREFLATLWATGSIRRTIEIRRRQRRLLEAHMDVLGTRGGR